MSNCTATFEFPPLGKLGPGDLKEYEYQLYEDASILIWLIIVLKMMHKDTISIGIIYQKCKCIILK